jgi:hypothetical protein
MATPFSDLYASIRLLLGDIGSTVTYSNDQLDLALDWAVKEDSTEDGDFTASAEEITPDVSDAKDFLRLCVRAALTLVDPAANPLYYKFAGVTVWRQDGMVNLQQTLRNKLRKLSDLSADELVNLTEWNQYLSGSTWQTTKSQESVS